MSDRFAIVMHQPPGVRRPAHLFPAIFEDEQRARAFMRREGIDQARRDPYGDEIPAAELVRITTT